MAGVAAKHLKLGRLPRFQRAAIFRAEGEDGQETLIPSLTVTIFARGRAGREGRRTRCCVIVRKRRDELGKALSSGKAGLVPASVWLYSPRASVQDQRREPRREPGVPVGRH